MRIGKPFALYVIYCDWMNVLNMLGLSLDLLGHPVMARLTKYRSICAHSANYWILLIWGWIFCTLSEMMARSSAYAIVVHMDGEVLK